MKTVLLAMLLVAISLADAAWADYARCVDEKGTRYWAYSSEYSPPTKESDKNPPRCKPGIPDSFLPQLPDSYRYIDRNGIVFWVDSADMIPPEYRGQNQTAPSPQSIQAQPEPPPEKAKSYTRVSIRNNQIIVPVLLANRGHRTIAKMILDTGASSTIIYPKLARKLGLGGNKVAVGYSKIADGSQVASYQTKIDTIQIDESAALKNPEVVIMDSVSDLGADGLLGNTFLRFFHFTIDYDNQVIVWE